MINLKKRNNKHFQVQGDCDFNLPKTDTPLVWTLSMPPDPQCPYLMGFDCNFFNFLIGKKYKISSKCLILSVILIHSFNLLMTLFFQKSYIGHQTAAAVYPNVSRHLYQAVSQSVNPKKEKKKKRKKNENTLVQLSLIIPTYLSTFLAKIHCFMLLRSFQSVLW